MKRKKGTILWSILLVVVIILAIVAFMFRSKVRTDVYLHDFEVKDNVMTLKVVVQSSAGYVKRFEEKVDNGNHYLKFYSTFGINSKLGAKDTYEIKISDETTEIYFYMGNDEYLRVLEKNAITGEWERTIDKTRFTIKDTTVDNPNLEHINEKEEIYKDDNYTYYLESVKSHLIEVVYSDGLVENVKEALNNKNIKITDLDKFGITYIKEENGKDNYACYQNVLNAYISAENTTLQERSLQDIINIDLANVEKSLVYTNDNNMLYVIVTTTDELILNELNNYFNSTHPNYKTVRYDNTSIYVDNNINDFNLDADLETCK